MSYLSRLMDETGLPHPSRDVAAVVPAPAAPPPAMPIQELDEMREVGPVRPPLAPTAAATVPVNLPSPDAGRVAPVAAASADLPPTAPAPPAPTVEPAQPPDPPAAPAARVTPAVAPPEPPQSATPPADRPPASRLAAPPLPDDLPPAETERERTSSSVPLPSAAPRAEPEPPLAFPPPTALETIAAVRGWVAAAPIPDDLASDQWPGAGLERADQANVSMSPIAPEPFEHTTALDTRMLGPRELETQHLTLSIGAIELTVEAPSPAGDRPPAAPARTWPAPSTDARQRLRRQYVNWLGGR